MIADHSGARRILFNSALSREAAAHAQRLGARMGAVGAFDCLGIAALDEAAVPEPMIADRAGQVAVLMYTSGTTGAPKAVMLSHQNVLVAAKTWGILRGRGRSGLVYGVPPMSHTAYKRPTEIILLDALPAASMGKVLKNKLRDLAAQERRLTVQTLGGGAMEAAIAN